MADPVARLAGAPLALRLMVVAGSGALAGLGHAPYNLWPLTIAALALLLALHRDAPSARYAAWAAWAFGVGYFGVTLRWIIEPFLVDAARHGWMAPFALVLMAGGAALFWALAGWLAHRLVAGQALILALMLVLAELARALIFTGFPWGLLGHIWVPTTIAQLAAYGGPHLLSLVTVFAAWALVLMRWRIWVGVAGLLGLMALAVVVRPGPVPALPADAPVVRLVQPNAEQRLKWDPAYRDVFLNRLVSLSEEGPLPDLLVWPETAVPSLLNYIAGDLLWLEEAARGAPLVFGIQRFDAEGGYFNSLVVLEPGGRIGDVYDKRHLVPFGEYIPGVDLVSAMGFPQLAGLVGTGFSKGQRTAPVFLPGIGSAVPLICYEGIFAEEISTKSDPRPRLLLLITNDAWFGQDAGPYQHLAQARLRAIEQGLPMVRVANTGVSAMIDGRGRIVKSIPLNTAGAIDAALPDALPRTVYAVWGDWPAIALLFSLILCNLTLRRLFMR